MRIEEEKKGQMEDTFGHMYLRLYFYEKPAETTRGGMQGWREPLGACRGEGTILLHYYCFFKADLMEEKDG